MPEQDATINAVLLLLAWASFWRTLAWTRPRDPLPWLTGAKVAAETALLLAVFKPSVLSLAVVLLSALLNTGVQFSREKRWLPMAMLAAAILATLLVLLLHWSSVEVHGWVREQLGGPAPRRLLVTLLGLGLLLQDGNLIIALVFQAIRLRAPEIPPNAAGLRQADVFDATATAQADDAQEAAGRAAVAPAGRYIGMLERALIYFFALGGAYQAIGFVLAAKGFARFKEMDYRPFAEYVLIGTLLSTAAALAIAELAARFR